MTETEVAEALADADVEPYVRASLGEAKEILAACLDAGIPALLDRGECCGSSGCGCAPKLDLCVRPEDAPRVAALMRDRWRALAEREGLLDEEGGFALAESGRAGGGDASAGNASVGAEPACPACGVAAPLVAGACSGCGLQLA